jgi:hypothetical protein
MADTSSSSSGVRDVTFIEVKRRDKISEKWKQMIPRLLEMCKSDTSALTSRALSYYLANVNIIGYMHSDTNDVKSFVFLEKGLNTIDNDSSVPIPLKNLTVTIICSNKKRRGYATHMFKEIEKYARENAYEYIFINEPVEDTIKIVKKLGYTYPENEEHTEIIKYGDNQSFKVVNEAYKKL